MLAKARLVPTMALLKLTTARVAQKRHSEPGPPPSLHELPPALWQLFVHIITGEWGGGGGDAVRPSQSTHSLSDAHIGNSEPGPPSSHSASKKHVFVQMTVPARKGAGLAAGDGSDWPGP
jgi:hypothetical protein